MKKRQRLIKRMVPFPSVSKPIPKGGEKEEVDEEEFFPDKEEPNYLKP